MQALVIKGVKGYIVRIGNAAHNQAAAREYGVTTLEEVSGILKENFNKETKK